MARFPAHLNGEKGTILGYQNENDEPSGQYSLEGLREGLKAIPFAVYHATVGRIINLLRGKRNKLETDAEGWKNLEAPRHFTGEKD